MNLDRRRKVAEACGWKVVQHIHGGTVGFHPVSGRSEMVPNFDLSLDAIVPAIEAIDKHWSAARQNDSYVVVVLDCRAEAKTFADAACLAFLAAKGVK